MTSDPLLKKKKKNDLQVIEKFPDLGFHVNP